MALLSGEANRSARSGIDPDEQAMTARSRPKSCAAWNSILRIFCGLTKYLSLAVEGGFDHTKNPNAPSQYDGWLRKITFAPQIGAGRKFFSRPVLRTFVTYANWSDGLKGYVGGVPYQKRTQGLTYGVQCESWW